MAAQLEKSLVLYSANVFLEVIPSGSALPAAGDLRFPLETGREAFFHFSVGQMAGLTPDDADYEEITEIYLDQLPETPEGVVDIWVLMHVFAEKQVYVEVRLTPVDSEELLQDHLVFGPFDVN